jgi:hypothetical protein
MAVRYTVYCKRSAADVTPAQLLAGARIADLHTIAENDDVPDVLILDALKQLRIENIDTTGFRFYRLSYRADGLRQIDIQRWQTPAEVRIDVAEVLENLEANGHPALQRIRSHLSESVDVVDAAFGSMPGERMAPILASKVTRWLAQHYDGIICAADDKWWELGPRYHEYQRLRQ